MMKTIPVPWKALHRAAVAHAATALSCCWNASDSSSSRRPNTFAWYARVIGKWRAPDGPSLPVDSAAPVDKPAMLALAARMTELRRLAHSRLDKPAHYRGGTARKLRRLAHTAHRLDDDVLCFLWNAARSHAARTPGERPLSVGRTGPRVSVTGAIRTHGAHSFMCPYCAPTPHPTME